ncbi:MAG: tRNA 2-thiocytidine(32) synthetase TtcA, partial [Ferrovum sp.]|nr:tRNA 2-thiocytidine(32) synthetase TtcA [Ferrovum sp.]
IIETMFLNMFYGGRLKAMPPKLVTDDGHHIVIRPLAYCTEKDLASYARHRAFPIIPCDLCGSQDNLKRAAIKTWLKEQDREFPGRVDNIFLALQSVTPSHLADTVLFDFAHLKPSLQADPEGDTLFDPATLERGALRLSAMEDRRIHFVKAGNSDKIKD